MILKYNIAVLVESAQTLYDFSLQHCSENIYVYGLFFNVHFDHLLEFMSLFSFFYHKPRQAGRQKEWNLMRFLLVNCQGWDQTEAHGWVLKHPDFHIITDSSIKCLSFHRYASFLSLCKAKRLIKSLNILSPATVMLPIAPVYFLQTIKACHAAKVLPFSLLTSSQDQGPTLNYRLSWNWRALLLVATSPKQTYQVVWMHL